MTADWRSLLFVPADAEGRIARAAASDADAVILDLEDGVARERKDAGRAALGIAVRQVADAGKAVLVRINGGWRDAWADLDAAIIAGVSAIMVPKAEDAARMTVVAEMVAELSAARSLGSVPLVALVESPAGILALPQIARAPRVAALAFGPEDFATAMGVPPIPEVLDLPCRQVALAAAAAGIAAFATPVSIAAFRDEAATEAAARAARAFGVGGALCIHPRQVAVANRTFRPDPAEMAQAQAIDDAWRAAGSAGVATLDGRMIDAPVAERAHRLLRRAKRWGKV